MNLIIDCSLNYLEIGLIDNGNIIDTYFVIQEKNLTKILIPSIETFLKKHNLDKTLIKKLYVINGPGSFTSIKLIAVLANVWKTTTNISLYQINTCLWNVNNINCLSYLDAKSNLVYLQTVENGVIKEIALIKKDEFESIKNLFVNKHKYVSMVDCTSKQNLINKWNYIKNSFTKVDLIKPLYIKGPI